MGRLWILFGLMLCFLLGQTANQPAADRAIRLKSPKAADVYSEGHVAMVIGNGAYAVGPLVNPPNDV